MITSSLWHIDLSNWEMSHVWRDVHLPSLSYFIGTPCSTYAAACLFCLGHGHHELVIRCFILLVNLTTILFVSSYLQNLTSESQEGRYRFLNLGLPPKEPHVLKGWSYRHFKMGTEIHHQSQANWWCYKSGALSKRYLTDRAVLGI